MKKRLLLMISCFFVCVTFMSCASKSLVEIASDNSYDEFVETTEVVSQVSSDAETESEYIESEQVEPVENFEDPLDCLRVTESFAKDNFIVCLYRNGNLYGLSKIANEKCYEYNLGYSVMPGGATYYVGELVHYRSKSVNGPYYMTAGNLPEIVLQEDDELRVYHDQDNIDVYAAEIVGYSPEMEYKGSSIIYDYTGEKSSPPQIRELSEWKSFMLKDNDGNVITEDINSFEDSFVEGGNDIKYQKGKKYWISYIRDFNEYNWPVTADCTVYKLNCEYIFNGAAPEPTYELTGTIDTVDKCYKFNFSEVTSGLYQIGNCLVTVK